MTFWSGLWTVAAIELRQRVRGVAWYVLLAIFFFLELVVTLIAWLALASADQVGDALYAIVIYFTLLLATLVTPALAGNAINGERDAGTLATMQVTLASTAQIVLGKFLAAWLSALAFVAASAPFIILTVAVGGLSVWTVVVSLAVLFVEMGVIAAFGVGLSGILRRPLFSVVVTYLLVALLSVGTLIAFTLIGSAIQERGTYQATNADWERVYRDYDAGINPYQPSGEPKPEYCTITNTYDYTVLRFDTVWWTLAANPYVVLADAVPTAYSRDDEPVSLFGFIKVGVRQAQLPPEPPSGWNECDPASGLVAGWDSSRQLIDSTLPSWFVGLALHVAGAAALLWGAISATRTPARRLAPGSRIA